MKRHPRLVAILAGLLIGSGALLFRGLHASSEETAPSTPITESKQAPSDDDTDAAEPASTSAVVIPDYRSGADSPAHLIHDVTVYSDRAEITRESQLKLKSGVQWVHVGPLPHNLDRTSVKLKTSSASPVKIGQVLMEESFERGGLPPDLKKRVDGLRELYGELLARTQKELAVQQVSGFVHSIRLDEPFPKSGQKEFQPFTAKVDQLQASIEELTRQSSGVDGELKIEHEKILDLQNRIELAQNEIRRFTQLGEQKWVVHLYALVESSDAQGAKLDLSYQIPNALWHPVYDVRAELNRETGTADIRLVTAGLVEQHTGENWDKVGLALSTLDPVPLFLPKLTRWTLAEARQEAPTPPGSKKPKAMNRPRDESKSADNDTDERTNKKEAFADKAAVAHLEPRKSLQAGAGGGAASPIVAAPEEAEAPEPPPALSEDDSGAAVGALAKSGAFGNKAARGAGRQRSDAPDGSFFPMTKLEQLYPTFAEVNRSVASMNPKTDQTRLLIAQLSSQAPAQTSYGDSSLPAVQAGGRVMEFVSPFSVDLKSDDPPYKIPVHSQALKGELSYFAIPKMDTRVYLRAKTINTADRPILGGAAQIFMDGDLVSKTSLGTISEGSYFTVDLGVDRNVQTKRIVTKKSHDAGILGQRHVTDVEVLLELANHHPFPVKMEVQDHYPLSPNDDIRIALENTLPKANDDHYGVLEWQVTVPPRQKTVLKFTYKVDHPEKYLVSEFN